MFSVVIPLYNKEQYIAKTIESVLLQTFQEYEIIVVDDGSTDNSTFEVKRYNDNRIRLIQQENAGVSAARNRGIEEANYDLIAFLDADDEWLPNHLRELMNLRINYPECEVFATGYKIVDSDGHVRFPVDTSVMGLASERGIILNYFDTAIKTAPPLCSSAIAVKKTALNEVGGFPLGVKLGEDLLTWARLADKYKIAYSKNITAIYNFKAYTEMIDDEPMPDENDVVGNSLKGILKNTRKNKTELQKYIALWHRMRANLYMSNRIRKKAIAEIIMAIYYDPLMYKNYVLLFLYLVPYSVRESIVKLRLKQQQKRLL